MLSLATHVGDALETWPFRRRDAIGVVQWATDRIDSAPSTMAMGSISPRGIPGRSFLTSPFPVPYSPRRNTNSRTDPRNPYNSPLADPRTIAEFHVPKPRKIPTRSDSTRLCTWCPRRARRVRRPLPLINAVPRHASIIIPCSPAPPSTKEPEHSSRARKKKLEARQPWRA
jgi:hypothetical protein